MASDTRLAKLESSIELLLDVRSAIERRFKRRVHNAELSAYFGMAPTSILNQWLAGKVQPQNSRSIFRISLLHRGMIEGSVDLPEDVWFTDAKKDREPMHAWHETHWQAYKVQQGIIEAEKAEKDVANAPIPLKSVKHILKGIDQVGESQERVELRLSRIEKALGFFLGEWSPNASDLAHEMQTAPPPPVRTPIEIPTADFDTGDTTPAANGFATPQNAATGAANGEGATVVASSSSSALDDDLPLRELRLPDGSLYEPEMPLSMLGVGKRASKAKTTPVRPIPHTGKVPVRAKGTGHRGSLKAIADAMDRRMGKGGKPAKA